MFTRYDLVQFENKSYGVMKTRFGLFKSFVDFNIPHVSWQFGDMLFCDCQTNNKQRAITLLHIKQNKIPKYTIIKDSLDE